MLYPALLTLTYVIPFNSYTFPPLIVLLYIQGSWSLNVCNPKSIFKFYIHVFVPYVGTRPLKIPDTIHYKLLIIFYYF